jgi:hypothetical protein
VDESKAYLILDKISPRVRVMVSVVLIIAGFLLQWSTRNILAGMPFILMCLVLNLVRSVSIKKVVAENFQWQEVTPDRIEQVLTHCRALKKFRSKNLGCFFVFLIAVIFATVFLYPLITEISLPFVLNATIVNAVVLFSGLILSGRKSAWMPPGLDIKAEIVKQMIESPMIKNDPGLDIAPYLEIGRTENGSFPNDTRILVRFKDAPDAFIGLQGQISINTVKSTVYPYFYTVLLARPEFGLFERYGSAKVSLDKITVENKETGEVDVIVIRQTTTKTSGYHTNRKMQDYILETSIKLARTLF